jgi:diacylglycerol kinase family enzyme
MTGGPVAFVLNARAGGGRDGSVFAPYRARIEALAQGGPVVVVEAGDDIGRVVEDALALGCRAVVGGGGDGTLNAVASRLVGRETIFGVLPFGTLNHFAKDVGIPLDIGAALETIRAGNVESVDVGQIAGRYFLNNASLGLYARMVRHRERQRAWLGRGKWPAFAWAAWSALRRFPFMRLRMAIGASTAEVRTPFLFIGNNAYEINGPQLGARRTLQGGVLSVHYAPRASRLRLMALALRALAGRLQPSSVFRAVEARALRVESEHRTLRLAADGEVFHVKTPLECALHPRALRVFVPRREAP